MSAPRTSRRGPRRIAPTTLVVLLALGAAPVSWPARALAGEVEFSASVDRTRVPLNGQLRLTISTAVPDASRIGHLEVPDTGSLTVLSTRREQSMSFSFSGGSSQYKKFTNTVLILKPTRVGPVRIGPAELTYAGRTYKTKPIQVQVTAARPGRPSGPTSPLPGWPRAAPDDDFFHDPLEDLMRRPQPVGANDIFIRAYASPDAVVEGQQFTVSVYIYSRVGARTAPVRWPKLDPFYAIDREVKDAPTQEKLIDGVPYRYKLLARKALFPISPGQFEIGPIEVEVEVSNSPFFPSTSRTLKTRAIPLKVEPLPPGAPAGFHRSNVGRFTLSAQVDTNRVALNQPVTYSLTVRGTGNIQNLRAPELPTLERFKVFDPTVDVQQSQRGSQVKGSKTFEYILLPLAAGKLTIPALKFSYYDPRSGQYRTLQTKAQEIEVTASGAQGAIADGGGGHEVNIVAGAFKPIRFDSDLKGYGSPFYQHAVFVPLLVLPPLVYLLVLFGLFIRSRILTDSPRSRMRRAALEARRHWRSAGKKASTGQAGEFYLSLKEALLRAVEARTGLAAHGLQLSHLQRQLSEQGAPGQLIEQLGHEIENCDFGRFAPAQARGEEMSSAHERVGRLIKALQREWATGRSAGGRR